MSTLQNSKQEFIGKFVEVMERVVARLNELGVDERMSAKTLGDDFATTEISAQMISSAVTSIVNSSSNFTSKVGRNGGIVRLSEDTLLDQESNSVESVAV